MRPLGLAAFDNERSRKKQYQLVGDALLAGNIEQMNSQLAKFKQLLANFALEHGRQIRSEPSFRNEFARMCAVLGVDPLNYSTKNDGGSVWSTVFAKDINDFYFGLAVRIIEKCRETRGSNGGIIALDKLLSDLNKGAENPISQDDIVRAVESLKPFGPGLHIEKLHNGSTVLVNVPKELNRDQTNVLSACEALGYVTTPILADNMGWDAGRGQYVLDEMVASGLLWIDKQVQPTQYWSPAAVM